MKCILLILNLLVACKAYSGTIGHFDNAHNVIKVEIVHDHESEFVNLKILTSDDITYYISRDFERKYSYSEASILASDLLSPNTHVLCFPTYSGAVRSHNRPCGVHTVAKSQ